jgi:hypothetical protein
MLWIVPPGLHRAGGDDALWSAANPEKKVDAGSFPSRSYGGGDVTIREQPGTRTCRSHVGY